MFLSPSLQWISGRLSNKYKSLAIISTYNKHTVQQTLEKEV